MRDPATGMLVVRVAGKRLSKAETALVRQALWEGRQVVFTDRHQWRHFVVRS